VIWPSKSKSIKLNNSSSCVDDKLNFKAFNPDDNSVIFIIPFFFWSKCLNAFFNFPLINHCWNLFLIILLNFSSCFHISPTPLCGITTCKRSKYRTVPSIWPLNVISISTTSASVKLACKSFNANLKSFWVKSPEPSLSCLSKIPR